MPILIGQCRHAPLNCDKPSLVIRVALTVSLVLVAWASSAAAAEESDYCRAVRARASSDAALLLWPRVIVQGIRFPSTGSVDLATATGSHYHGFQARIGLSLSPLDLYRGVRVLGVGDADCQQKGARENLREAITHAIDVARLTALREQTAYLEAHRDAWRALAAKAEQRLTARVVTLVEFDEVRRQVDALEHRLADLRGDARQIEANGVEPSYEPLDRLAQRYLQRAGRFDRAMSHLRALDAVQLQVTAGIVPENPTDWYGLAEASFNLGGFMRVHEENEYLAAHADELRRARYELGAALQTLRKQVAATLDQLREDSAVRERELAFLSTSRTALEKSDAPSVAHARDTLAIEQISLESDRVFIGRLAASLRALMEDSHAR